MPSIINAPLLLHQGEAVTFNQTVGSGTSVTILWDFKDGSSDTFTFGPMLPWPAGHHEVRVHNFMKPGNYNVEVTIFNNDDQYTHIHAIVVYNEVANLTLTSDAPTAYINRKGPVSFCFETSLYPPTAAKVWFDYGDDTVSKMPPYPNFGLCTKAPQANIVMFPHTYLQTG